MVVQCSQVFNESVHWLFVDNEERLWHGMDAIDVEDVVLTLETSNVVEWPLGVRTTRTSTPFSFESLGKAKREIEVSERLLFRCDQLVESAGPIET